MTFDPYILNYEGLPPLWLAIQDKNFELATQLIEKGNALDDFIEEDGESHLHRAAASGDMEVVDFYLKHNCRKTLNSFDCINFNPLITAAKNGQVEIVRKLLLHKVDPNYYDVDNIGNTAIREAVEEGHTEVVKLLLKYGADPLLPGWCNLSAVDQAFLIIDKKTEKMKEIRKILQSYPSKFKKKK